MPEIRKLYDEAMDPLIAPGAHFEIVAGEVAGNPVRRYKNAPETVCELFAPAYQHGDKEFLIYEGERWSFSHILSQAAEIGQSLVNKYGVAKGDRVAIAMRNVPEWMTAFIGITSIGAVVVPLNSWGTARELEYALGDAGVKVLFCDEQRYQSVASALPALGANAIVVRAKEVKVDANVCSFEGFLQGATGLAMPAVELAATDPVMIMYTSGTTGKPKGALSTHAALGQAIFNFECTGMALAMSNMDIVGKMMEKGLEPTNLLAVPLFHVSGCHAQFLVNLRAGRRIVMMYKWDAIRALQYIETEKITMISAAPTMILDLLESPGFAEADTSSLSGVGLGGAATPAKTIALISERVPDNFSGTGWGMTETNALGSSMTGAAFNRANGSAGFIHPIVDVEIRDESGAALDHGNIGSLWVKSASLVSEYWNRADANASEFREGWFNSGDMGYTTGDGYLFLSDRAKDMVIRGGENIYPVEIESQVINLAGVLEAVAFGLPHERLGEELALTVVTKVGSKLDEASVHAYCREHLAAFKVPSRVFITSEPLPRNATKKVLKRQVKAAALAKI
ncbi:MAG: long-chain acyl-CoA synthetase [Halieaceae bacterium]|jgi:long-chain acyl-CoA synthetase